jgi:hypothetical protein
VNLNDPRNAQQRGWGPGWPANRQASMVDLVVNGTHFPAGAHQYIAPLTEILLTESVERHFIELVNGWCWGYANRPIKLPNGGSSGTASNHSWGLALDLNAPVNPFGGNAHQIPAAMGALWNAYGFRWGGNYSGTRDWMHFEFMGTPAEARSMLAKAEEDLVLSDEQKKDLEWANGMRSFFKGEKVPRKAGPKREGWKHGERSVSEPKPQ